MSQLKQLLYVPSIWSHFAATVLNSRLPLSLVACARGSRYVGEPKTNLVNLVVHGLSAIAVFSEVMLTRLLLFLVLATSTGALVTLIVVALRLFTNVAAPGWATSVIGTIAIICLQTLLLVMMAAFIVLSNRSTIALPPILHAKDFIDDVVMLFPRNAPRETTEPFALPGLHENPR
jgi:polyisoprenyl-phosphate glycosyltransferase